MKERCFSYPSADGIHAIAAREWLPDGQPRGVVQIVHGVAEYTARYRHVAEFLTAAGFLVCGADHLGHGETAGAGEFGFFAPKHGWALVSRDVARLRDIQGEKYPGLPYCMLGHSMGSVLTRTYLIDHPGALSAAVLSGTGQENALAVAFGRALAQLLCLLRGPRYVSPLVYQLSLGAYNRAFRPNRTGADWISRDTQVVDAYLRDPRCTFRPTASMFRDLLSGIAYIGRRRNLAKMDPSTPVYFLSGDRDPVGGMGKGVRKVAAMFRSAACWDVTVKLYPGGRHEMLNELNRREVLLDLLAWLEKTLF